MRLNHNMASLNIYKEQNRILAKQNKAMERVSSGLKVNSSKENPNAMSQSERLRIQIRGVQMAARNVQDGSSMIQTAEGGLEGITSMLQRVRELVVQAGNGTYSEEDKKSIQLEISEFMKGIDDIAKNNEFNGVKLLSDPDVNDNSRPGRLFMPSGANVNERVEIPTFNLAFNSGAVAMADGTVRDLSTIDVLSKDGINNALSMIDSAIDTVVSARGKFGALENRLESSYYTLNEISDKIQGAESAIRDADVAEEMVEISKDNILVDAGNAIMAQTNRFPQDILKTLENMRR